jgi:tetratricopeptide (TPR) repeat protein
VIGRFTVKGVLKAVWLGMVLALSITLLLVMRKFAADPSWGLLYVIILSAALGFLICIPLAATAAERAMNKIFGGDKGKISKDYSRAKRLLVEERFEEAIREFRRAVEEEPENVSLRLEIAEIYSRDLREYEKAIGEYEEALALGMLDSQRVSILNRIADIYEGNLGDVEMAKQILGRITERFAGTAFARRAAERIAGMAEGEEGLAGEG